MTSPLTFAPSIWGIPVVQSATDRAALFPTPPVNQRVQNLSTATIERWTGVAWVPDALQQGVQSVTAQGAAGDGTTDDRADFVAAQTAVGANGQILVPPGTYRIGSNLTITSALRFLPGAILAPDSGVTITISGPLQAGLHQIFGGAGVILFGRGRVNALYPEWWGAANSAAASVNRVACQAAICASLGVTSIAAALVAQPTLLYAPVVLSALYPVDGSIYCPRYTCLRGAAPGRRYGFSATANNINVLVLGRQLLETDWVDITFEDFDIEGSYSATGQVGIKAQFSGSGGYVSPLTFTNIKMSFIGGIGIELLGDVGSMIVRLYWDKVTVDRATSYTVHTKIGIINQLTLDNCYFSDSGNGFFIEDDGSLTNTVENFQSRGTVFEANGAQAPAIGVGTVSCAAGAATFSTSQAGKIINGAVVTVGGTDYTVSAFNGTTSCTLSGAPTFGASAFTWYAYAVGSFAFKSTMHSGFYEFDNCYFEENGSNPSDTTGAHIWVREPGMLKVHKCLFNASNNDIWLNHGGDAILEGNFVLGGAAHTAVVTIDDVPSISVYSNVQIGRNYWPGTNAYTEAQVARWLNGASTATTTVTGFTDAANYVESPARQHRQVLRDGRSKVAGDGAIGYNAIKRITDNAGGANSIAVNGVGTIIKDTYQGLAVISTDTGQSLGLFLFGANIGAGGAVVLASQASSGTYFSITKDTASHMNVYWETALNAFVIQNKMAGAIKVAVRFVGSDWLQHNDDGYYETQYA